LEELQTHYTARPLEIIYADFLCSYLQHLKLRAEPLVIDLFEERSVSLTHLYGVRCVNLASNRISDTNNVSKDLRFKIAKIMSGEDESHVKSQHPTIFHGLLISDLPLKEKSLDEAIPDPTAKLDLINLEKLPYLSACIQEGIRLFYGVSAPNPRISPDKAMRYKDWVIQAGTPVSMTTIDVHHDEDVFPNSREYIPERWLHNPKPKENDNLSRYFVAFGKGARSCLGIKYYLNILSGSRC
jgi:hypothetical protein